MKDFIQHLLNISSHQLKKSSQPLKIHLNMYQNMKDKYCFKLNILFLFIFKLFYNLISLDNIWMNSLTDGIISFL